MAAMVIGFFDPKNPLVQINQKLHSSAAYNVFRAGVNALAIFIGAASSTMKCFVAGTLVLTASGLVAIESIKAGDKVISTNAETFEAAEKKVLETYIRETTELVHLTISGEMCRISGIRRAAHYKWKNHDTSRHDHDIHVRKLLEQMILIIIPRRKAGKNRCLIPI